MAEAQKTRAERLDAVLSKLAPTAVKFHQEHGAWPTPDDANGGEAPADRVKRLATKLVRDDKLDEKDATAKAESAVRSRQNAPYVIQTLRDGKVRILVTKDDGSQAAGVGADVEAALTQLEGGAA